MSGQRKTVKQFHEPGDCHELTFSCDRRMPFLTNDKWRNLLAEGLDRAVCGQSCRPIAYVFISEHVHILVQPTTNDIRIDLLLKAIKAPFSTRIRRCLEDGASPLLERFAEIEDTGRVRPVAPRNDVITSATRQRVALVSDF